MPGIAYLIIGTVLLFVSARMTGPPSLLKKPIRELPAHFRAAVPVPHRITRFGLTVAGFSSALLGLWLSWHGH